MKVIVYRITLLEPALVTALAGDPNSDVAFDYLPGSVLRGAIVGQYLQYKKIAADAFDAASDEARRLFFSGGTRYLNGYLVDSDKRTLPTPLSWQREKGDDENAFDFTLKHLSPDEEKQWQSVKNPFCWFVKERAISNGFDEDDEGDLNGKGEPLIIHLLTPSTQLAVHTARDRQAGRARTDSGAVYRYESLSAGQTFEAAVLCDEKDEALFTSLIKGRTTLGGSRSGGYGRAEICCKRDDEGKSLVEDTANWREVGEEVVTEVDGKLTVTLLSDALLRNKNGQMVVDKETVSLTITQQVGELRLLDSFYRGQATGGFNRKWGLPLPQSLAVKMGSVFVFDKPDCDEDELKKKLQELERQGIGERRSEGFGRVAVNWHRTEKLKVYEKEDKEPDSISIASDAASKQIAELMTTRMLRNRLDEKVVNKVNVIFGESKKAFKPHPSQLSRLRLIVQDEIRQIPAFKKEEIDKLITQSRERILGFFAKLEVRQVTRKQFSSDRLEGEPLMKWLKNQVQDTRDVWERLGGGALPRIGDAQPDAPSLELIYEYNLRLIDAVLARAIKLKQEGK